MFIIYRGYDKRKEARILYVGGQRNGRPTAGLLGRRPYITSSATGGLVMLSGDWLAQRYEHRGPVRGQYDHDRSDAGSTICRASDVREGEYDKIRATVMTGFSVTAFMPVNTFWYRNVVERCDRLEAHLHSLGYVAARCVLLLTRMPVLYDVRSASVLPDLAKHRVPFPRGALALCNLPFLAGRTLVKAVCTPARPQTGLQHSSLLFG